MQQQKIRSALHNAGRRDALVLTSLGVEVMGALLTVLTLRWSRQFLFNEFWGVREGVLKFLEEICQEKKLQNYLLT